MIFRKFDNNCKLLDGCEVHLEDVLSLLDEYLERTDTKYKNGDEQMAATSFTISRSPKDFLHINCDGQDEVWFLSDRLVFNMHFLLRIFSDKTNMAFGGNKTLALRVISDFFKLSRRDFENEYSMGYQNPQKHGYVQVS